MPLAYVINELDSSVTTYRFDAQRGSLQPIQILPSTPASYTGNNHGAEIALAPSGRIVYASNRGHDSIAIFAVDGGSGTLTPVGWALTRAKSPRFFGLDPAAKTLYAANADEDFSAQQDTDTIRGVQYQPGERDADSDRSGHQNQQPVHDRLRQSVTATRYTVARLQVA